jgi:hypothetical protein
MGRSEVRLIHMPNANFVGDGRQNAKRVISWEYPVVGEARYEMSWMPAEDNSAHSEHL